MRREYSIDPIIVNGRIISKVVVDPHVDKHSDHINDELIVKIVCQLNGEDFLAVDKNDDFSYFASELKFEGNWYKLVWLLEEGEIYIGIITLYKDRRIK